MRHEPSESAWEPLGIREVWWGRSPPQWLSGREAAGPLCGTKEMRERRAGGPTHSYFPGWDTGQRHGVWSNQKDLRGFPQEKIFFCFPGHIPENINLLWKAGGAAGMGPTRCCQDVIKLGHAHVMIKSFSLRLGVRQACLLSPRLSDTVLGVPATAIRQENKEKACRSERKNYNCLYLQMT